MAHYALVINSRVAQVMVIEEKDVDALRPAFEGELIQTSYNTRDGVHYGDDGKPDGGEALRLNYAQEGMLYDKDRDIFYRDHSVVKDGLFWLKEDDMTIQAVLPNKAVQRRYDRDSGEFKVYVTPEAQATLGGQAKDNLEASLNLLIPSSLEDAAQAWPFSMEEARRYALRSEYVHCRMLGSRPLYNLTDRLLQQKLVTPAVKTWPIRSLEELLAIPNQLIRSVRQRDHAVETSALNDTVWASPQDLANHLQSSFWDEQQDEDSDNGAFVVQPAILGAWRDLTLRFTVNAQGEIHIYSASRQVHGLNGDRLRELPHYEGVDELVASLTADLQANQVSAGFHSVTFQREAGIWKLWNWKPYLEGPWANAYPSVYPVLDDAILFMLGRDLRNKMQPYTEERSYAHHKLGRDVAAAVGSNGLFARWKDDQLDSVAAIGSGEREINERFDALDQQLTPVLQQP